MFTGDGIFVMFPGNVYFWFISVSRPALAGVWNSLLNTFSKCMCVVKDQFIV